MKRFLRKLFRIKPKGLPQGHPELKRRIHKLLGTDLLIVEIVSQLDFIQTASIEEFEALFKSHE